MRYPAAAVLVLFACASPAPAQDLSGLNGLAKGYTAAQDNTRVAVPAPVPVDQKTGRPYVKPAPPKDDIKPLVLRHLKASIAYCDAHMEDCNGAGNWLRNFAQTIGNGRCNNRGYNCVNGVLEMCQGLLEEKEITPMYYMACAAMLGKLGERDCAGGRASCAGRLQGSLYFSLRASAACYKSYEGDREQQPKAKALMDRFGTAVNRSVGGVYVRDAAPAHSTAHILVWEGAAEARNIAIEKVLEFTFEKLALHGAGAAVSAAGGPLLVFSGFMAFHEIAAARMNDEVCLNWNTYYNGSYANVTSSLSKISSSIK
ncbi:MAG: hypothetical protein WCK76_11240 [Elusimicrobiota bacterium]